MRLSTATLLEARVRRRLKSLEAGQGVGAGSAHAAGLADDVVGDQQLLHPGAVQLRDDHLHAQADQDGPQRPERLR